MSIRAWLEVGLAVVLIGLGWSAYSSMRAHGEAIAEARQATGERIEAQRRADAADSARLVEQERTREAIAEAERERARADQMADSLEAVGRAITVAVVETGASLIEAVEAAQEASLPHATTIVDTIAARLAQHLEADARQAENFRRRMAEMARGREASDSLGVWWRERALATEKALEARALECQRCAVSEERWRAAAQPSFFRGLLDDAGKLVVTVASTVVLVVLLL